MLIMTLLGSRLHVDVGRGTFLALFIGCGTFSSLVSLAAWTMRGIFTVRSLGASGAISGVTAAYLWLHSSDQFDFLGLFSDSIGGIPGWAILAGMAAWELYALRSRNLKRLKFDHYAHLGGMLGGIFGAEAIKRRVQSKANAHWNKRRQMSWRERLESWTE
jgi:rhomboid-like protein